MKISCAGLPKASQVLQPTASERIATAAFEYASKNSRKQVTAVHKANVCKQADGLFLASCAKVAEAYPHITFGDHLVRRWPCDRGFTQTVSHGAWS